MWQNISELQLKEMLGIYSPQQYAIYQNLNHPAVYKRCGEIKQRILKTFNKFSK